MDGRIGEQPYELAARYGAGFLVVECLCSDIDVHQFRIDSRDRDIPGWYELDWELPLTCTRPQIRHGFSSSTHLSHHK